MSQINKSRKLSFCLRHSPDVEIYPGGWVKLFDACKATNLTLEEVFNIVETDDRQRYSFDASRSFIKANYGHSISVDMQYKAIPRGTWEYPDYLFHLTKREFISSILDKGLLPGKRLYIHLYYLNEYEILPPQKADEIWLEINTELIKTPLYNPCERIYLTKCVPPKTVKPL